MLRTDNFGMTYIQYLVNSLGRDHIAKQVESSKHEREPR